MLAAAGVRAHAIAVFIITMTLAAGVRAAPATGVPQLSTDLQRRHTVAIVEVGGAVASMELATALAAAVAREDAIDPVADPAISAALLGPLPDEDGATIANATRALATAQERLSAFEPTGAIAQAQLGITQLLTCRPTVETTALLAELAFTEGLANLAAAQAEFAVAPLQLSHSLSPGRRLDPAQYVPEVIAAFEQARKSEGPPGAMTIDGDGTIWLDGKDVGDAPATVSAPGGTHLIVLYGNDRRARGVRVDLAPGAALAVKVPSAPAPSNVQVARARAELTEPGGNKMNAIAAIVAATGATDVFLIGVSTAGEVTVQRFRDNPATLDEPEPLGTRTAADILVPLLPPRPNPRPVLPPLLPKVPLPWWQRGWVQASIIGGVIAVVATSLALSSDGPGVRPVGSELGFD